jgi:hypothetical protein
MQSQPPKVMPVQNAIYLVNNRVNQLDVKLSNTISTLENKLGKHETFVTDNLPDIDLFNTAFSDINKRLLDLEALNDRIAVLESNLNIKPANVITSKKKSTIKLNELKDISTESGPGISFS